MEPAGRGRVERRLAAILAADVAGYSRLIEADEEGTLRRLKALRAEVVDPKIADHKGRIVKTTGDGLLVEFASVIDAFRCAAEVQAGMAQSNAPMPPNRLIEFRIGIHQGDFVVEDGDIFGDGVNVAARLEGLAEPGGICISARVQEDAAGRLDLAFEDMGEQSLKNIARPVRVYRVGPRPVSRAPSPPFRGEREGPAQREGKVGGAANRQIAPLTPLSPPGRRGGEGKVGVVRAKIRRKTLGKIFLGQLCAGGGSRAAGPPAPRQAVDRSVAVRQYERRSRAGVFRRRHGRGDHHGALAHPLALRHRPQFHLDLQGPRRRREAGWARTACRLVEIG